MPTLYSQKHERVILWDMGEDRWNKETQFPSVSGTMYRNASQLAAANVLSFQSGTQAALYQRPTYHKEELEAEMEISTSARKKKGTYKAKAPKHTPVDFSQLLHAKSGSPKAWHNATAFKSVTENIGARLKESAQKRKEKGIPEHVNSNNCTLKPVHKQFVFRRVATSSDQQSQVSESRKEDRADDWFNGAFQRAVNAIEKVGYKADKQDVRNYKLAGWKETSYQDLKKRIEEDHEDGDSFKVARFKKDVVIMIRGDIDIPVAWINPDGTLYQNTVKGSAWVQRQAVAELDKSESGQNTNDAAHHGMYISRILRDGSAADLKEYLQRNGLEDLQDDPHVTLAYSRDPFPVARASDKTVTCAGGTLGILGKDDGPKHLVLMLDQGAEGLTDRWNYFRKQGAGWDFDDFNPHVTICKIPEGAEVPDVSKYPRYEGTLEFGPEQIELLNEDA